MLLTILVVLLVYLVLEGLGDIAKSAEEMWPDVPESSDKEREVSKPPTDKDSLGE